MILYACSGSDDVMAGIAARRAAERAASALPGGLNGRMTAEEQDNVSRLSNISNASAKVQLLVRLARSLI